MKSCSVCNSTTLKKQFEATSLDYSSDQKLDIVQCENCTHGITSDVVNEIGLYEAGSYDAKEKIWHKLIRQVLQVLEKNKVSYLKKLLPSNSHVLEIGAGKGNFLLALRDGGFQIAGIEPSQRSFPIAAEKLGDCVVNCTIEEISLYPKINRKYNAIVFWHVLEHLQNPGAIVESVKNYLLPGGLLMIAVPNFNSLQAKFGKEKWYHLDPSRHLSHFTPQSLTNLLEKKGFGVKKIYFDSFFQNFVGEMITWTNKISPMSNIIFNTLRLNKFYFKKTGKIGVFILFIYSFAISLILAPFAFVWTFGTQIVRRSGTMVCLCKIN